MKFFLQNDSGELQRLAAELKDFGEQEKLPPKVVQQVNVALDELVTNVMLYGYDDPSAGVIEVELSRDGENITAVLSDDGRPFDPFQAKIPDVTLPIEDRSVGGLGVYFVRKLMDEYSYAYENGRNIVRLTKRVDGDS